MDSEEAWKKWSNLPNADNMIGLLESLNPQIDQAINRSGGQVSPISRGIAKRVLISAAKSYKPDQGTKFSSWANTQLQQLSRKLRESKFVTKVPELSAKRSFELRNLYNEIEAETGFPPSDEILADKMGLPLRKLKELRASTTPEIVADTGAAAEDDSSNDGLIHELVYQSLPPREQVVMQDLFGYNGSKKLSGKEIAKKLKITPAAVSQKAAKIQSMIESMRKMT